MQIAEEHIYTFPFIPLKNGRIYEYAQMSNLEMFFFTSSGFSK